MTCGWHNSPFSPVYSAVSCCPSCHHVRLWWQTWERKLPQRASFDLDTEKKWGERIYSCGTVPFHELGKECTLDHNVTSIILFYSHIMEVYPITHSHTHIYIYIYIYIHTHTHTQIYIYIYIHTYIRSCVIYMYIIVISLFYLLSI